MAPTGDGNGALMATTPLGDGDPNCPTGGLQIDYGVDDGDGGETAGDGVLGPGEIDSTEYLCNGEDEFAAIDSIEEPAGPVGSGAILATGGDGADGEGGDGGDIGVWAGTDNPGNLKVFTTGTADASFALPTIVSNLGPRPVVIAADVTPAYFDTPLDAVGLSDGDLFLASTNRELYTYRDSGNHDEATGLHVLAGATLTWDAATDDEVTVELDNDLVVDGTVTATLAPDGNRRTLTLRARGCYLSPGSLIEMSQTGAQRPRDFGMDCTGPGGGLLIAQGTIDNSNDGGDFGGRIQLYAENGIFNTGLMTAAGSNGASGGNVELIIDGGPLFNSGDLDASGGDTDQNGAGGEIIAYCDDRCAIRNSGNLNANGGNAVDENGSDGGIVELIAYDGELINTGDLSARGGDGEPTGGSGGHGGVINLGVATGDSGARSVSLSGIFDVSAGAGETGGNGGTVSIEQNEDCYGRMAPVTLYGFSSLDISGGNAGGSGDNAGGDAGLLELWHYSSSSLIDGGGIVNYAEIVGNGGNATGIGAAGDAAEFRFGCDDDAFGDRCFFADFGDVHASIGDGHGDNDVDRADFRVWAPGSVTVEADLYFAAGNALTSDYGGEGGQVDCQSYGDISWVGNIDARGGTGTADTAQGGPGGDVELEGDTVSFTGDLLLSGGDGGATLGAGGDGGSVDFFGLSGTTLSVGTGTVAPGSGNESGRPGTVSVDGLDHSASFLP